MRNPEPLRDTKRGAMIFGVVAVVIVAALIVVFLWRPWTIPQGATTNASPIARPTPAASTMPAPANMQHYKP